MEYAHPARRRLRAARRASAAVLRPRMWAGGVVATAYWWDGHPNFGDDLTPWLLPFYGILPIHRELDRAKLAGVGSVIDFLPEDFDGVIWGSGSMDGEPHPLPYARVLAVRGALTRELIHASGPRVALGDPGLLVSRWRGRPRVRWAVGFVPHGHHRSHAEFLGLARPEDGHRIVNVHQSARAAVREIASCAVIITTSLHGLVTADAYGIPAVWTTLEPSLRGGDFKFHDYESAITPGRSRFVPFGTETELADFLRKANAPDPDVIGQRVAGLEDGLRAILDGVGGFPRFPTGIVSAVR